MRYTNLLLAVFLLGIAGCQEVAPFQFNEKPPDTGHIPQDTSTDGTQNPDDAVATGEDTDLPSDANPSDDASSTDDAVLTDATDTPELDVPTLDAESEDSNTEDVGDTGDPQDTAMADTADVVDEPDADLPDPTLYLAHINPVLRELWLINVDTGAFTTACTFSESANYPSSTFGLDGTFYGSRDARFLDRIDPCTCEVTPVGDIGYTGVVGITANGVKDWELYGLSYISDILLTMDVNNGLGQPVGNGLNSNFGPSGTTWSANIAGLFAINSSNNTLYQIDTTTGIAINPVPINASFSTVGIEWHPGNGSLYACTGPNLYRVDTHTGDVESITTFSHTCNNLAAPWQPVACLDELLDP